MVGHCKTVKILLGSFSHLLSNRSNHEILCCIHLDIFPTSLWMVVSCDLLEGFVFCIKYS